MSLWNTSHLPPERKKPVLPTSINGFEFGVALSRNKALPGVTRMVIMSREVDTGITSLEEIDECASLHRLRRLFRETQDNRGTRLFQIVDNVWRLPVGRSSAFTLSLRALNANAPAA